MKIGIAEFSRLGRYDCGHTFDRQAFADIDVPALARKVARHGGAHGQERTYNYAHNLARVSLERSTEWESPEDWARQASFSEVETDVPLEKAYAAWKRGYVNCAAKMLTEWLLEA